MLTEWSDREIQEEGEVRIGDFSLSLSHMHICIYIYELRFLFGGNMVER